MNDNVDIGFCLKKINDFITANGNNHLKQLDMTVSQMHILMFVVHSEKSTVLQKEIERFFKLKHPTLVGLLKRMEKKELIRVEENPDDRRGNRVAALEKGIRTAAEMVEGRKYMDDMLTRDLSEEQKNELKELLRIIYTKTCTDNG
ncbi:MAG: MarR family transcriptional regulator [Oscillospiraceae bacterium]|nr:MarR family transcriptional regulator [Oscillospiraceae bacterium]